MKTVYVVWTTVDDRMPTTVEIEMFGTYDKALAYAKKQVDIYKLNGYVETNEPDDDSTDNNGYWMLEYEDYYTAEIYIEERKVN